MLYLFWANAICALLQLICAGVFLYLGDFMMVGINMTLFFLNMMGAVFAQIDLGKNNAA